MSEYDDFDDDQSEEESQKSGLPANLRKQIKDLQKKLDAAEKERDDARKSASDYQVRDVLTEFGLTEKRDLERVPRWLKADGIDLTDKAAVDAWLTENGDALGYKPQEVSEEDRQAAHGMSRIAVAESQGTPSSQRAEIEAEIAGAATADELTAVLKRYSHIKV